MKREAYERLRPPPGRAMLEDVLYCASQAVTGAPDMGLAPGGRMRQEIYDDPYDPREWDSRHASRCFVHLANSLVWRAITGEAPGPAPEGPGAGPGPGGDVLTAALDLGG